ncbi:hypothetical protein JCM11641_000414 [Rhodosporidiobolus odoratus]
MLELTLKPLDLAQLDKLQQPDYTRQLDTLLPSINDLIASLPTTSPSNTSWHPRKLYSPKSYPTQTWSTARGKVPPGTADTEHYKWHVRQSKLASQQGTYDQLKKGLLENHSLNEKEYIESCTEAKQLKVVFPGELEVWQTKYNNSPASNRDFTFALLTRETTPSTSTTAPTPTSADSGAIVSPGSTPLRSFVVVSIPVNAPVEKGFVRGRYVSVEHVQETEEGGTVWTMAVSSDPGGWVPRLISDWVMPGKVSEDVPSFLEWMKER